MSGATISPEKRRYTFNPQNDGDITALLRFRIPGFNNDAVTPFSWCKAHVKEFALKMKQLVNPVRMEDVGSILQEVVLMFNNAINRPEAPWIANKQIEPADPFLGTRLDDHVHIIPVTKSAD